VARNEAHADDHSAGFAAVDAAIRLADLQTALRMLALLITVGTVLGAFVLGSTLLGVDQYPGLVWPIVHFSGLALCQLTWFWAPDEVRRWYVLALIALTLMQYTVGYLFLAPQEALVGVLNTLLFLPLLLAVVAMAGFSRARALLITIAVWTATVSVIGANRAVLVEDGFDWRFGPLMGFVVLLYGYYLEIWIGHRRQLVAETMSRIELESDLALSRRAAKTDPLTGLMNRGGIDEVFETLDRSYQAFSLLMIDVDHFKRVNDTLGHDAGDAVLADVARVLAANLRGEDLVCRWGGEEFVGVVFSNDPVVVLAAAERIRSAVSSQVECGEFPVTVSIGVAHCDGRTPVERLLKVADVALLQAKRSGRDLVVTGST